jgi:hypothetical protein
MDRLDQGLDEYVNCTRVVKSPPGEALGAVE